MARPHALMPGDASRGLPFREALSVMLGAFPLYFVVIYIVRATGN
ncbi:hypothetical protein MAMMFC1_01832 [Methylomusa anaerophila]|uniref:Uncharacterized protein n=1 Tax=Methylomusa anaerophila TaxID=1930071 RepID=A0A348AJB3_9FIRM|nr:hypothetical protein MAMMFC1_01832 [Methylomusa anaerophila]